MQKIGTLIGIIVLFVIVGGLVEAIIGTAILTFSFLIMVGFWLALLLYVIYPSFFSNDFYSPSFSLKYVLQTFKHFLLIHMIPGMGLLTATIFFKDRVSKEMILPLIFGPLVLGFVIFSILAKLYPDKTEENKV